MTQKQGKFETDALTAGKVKGLADGMLVDARAVAYESEEMKRAAANT